MKKHVLIALILIMGAAVSMSFAQQNPYRFRVPEDILLPYYARIAQDAMGSEIYHNNEWAAVVFYYDPGDIPADFNLLGFYALDLLSADPKPEMTVEGFMLWPQDAYANMGPFSQLNIHGRGAVPVWFVSWPELQRAIRYIDGVYELTVSELGALRLLRGTAALYQEVLHPLEHITINAKGLLEDGRRFQFHATQSGFPPVDCCYGPKVQIRIW